MNAAWLLLGALAVVTDASPAVTTVPVEHPDHHHCSAVKESSELEFKSVPEILDPLTTTNVTLRCQPPDSHTHSGGSDNADIADVTSIVITKDGEVVAAVTQHGVDTSGHVNSNGNDNDHDHVSGSIDDGGFLQINLHYTPGQLTGNYACLLTGLDGAGHVHMVKHSVNLVEEKLNVEDLVYKMHHQIEMLQDKHVEMAESLARTTNELEDTYTKLNQLTANSQLTTNSGQTNTGRPLLADRKLLMEIKRRFDTLDRQVNQTSSKLTMTEDVLAVVAEKMNISAEALAITRLFLTLKKWKTSDGYKLPSGFTHATSHDKHVYLLSEKTPLNVAEYQETCQTWGGFLAQLETDDEWDVVAEWVKDLDLDKKDNSRSRFRDRPSMDESHSFVYLGMTDQKKRGKWRWMTSGDRLAKNVRWASGEPHGRPRENCGWLSSQTGEIGDWLCVDTSHSHRYLCEVPV